MRLIPLLVVLLTASPAFAQSRLWTNADLGRPLTDARPHPAEAAAILMPYQFVYVPSPGPLPWYDAPIRHDPDWPFISHFPPTGSPTLQRLDGTSVFDPPTVYGLPPYWGYMGHGVRGRSGTQTHETARSAEARASRRSAPLAVSSAAHLPRRW